MKYLFPIVLLLAVISCTSPKQFGKFSKIIKLKCGLYQIFLVTLCMVRLSIQEWLHKLTSISQI